MIINANSITTGAGNGLVVNANGMTSGTGNALLVSSTGAYTGANGLFQLQQIPQLLEQFLKFQLMLLLRVQG